jgi:hypothetical protein
MRFQTIILAYRGICRKFTYVPFWRQLLRQCALAREYRAPMDVRGSVELMLWTIGSTANRNRLDGASGGHAAEEGADGIASLPDEWGNR